MMPAEAGGGERLAAPSEQRASCREITRAHTVGGVGGVAGGTAAVSRAAAASPHVASCVAGVLDGAVVSAEVGAQVGREEWQNARVAVSREELGWRFHPLLQKAGEQPEPRPELDDSFALDQLGWLWRRARRQLKRDVHFQ